MLHTDGELYLMQNLDGTVLKVIQLYWHIILLSCIQCCAIPHTIDRSTDFRLVLAVYWIKLTPLSWEVCHLLCDEANYKCQLLDAIQATLDISLAKAQTVSFNAAMSSRPRNRHLFWNGIKTYCISSIEVLATVLVAILYFYLSIWKNRLPMRVTSLM